MAEQITVDLLLNADDAEASIKRMSNMLQSMGKKRTAIQLDDGSIVSVDERLKQIDRRLHALRNARKLRVLEADEVAEMQRLSAEADHLKTALRGAKTEARSFGQVFKTVSAGVAHFGGSMQTLGNTLTKISTPMRALMRGTLFAAGYKVLNTVTSGFSGAFERYDTMANYTKQLKALDLQAEKTFKVFKDQEEPMDAIHNLEQAVLGLPTGLDEIVASQKLYAGATGEMVRSTKAAIAANNTFIASGTDAQQQRRLQRYFVALASGAKLSAEQWTTMRRNAPLAFRAVAKEMKYADIDKFEADLKSGAVAANEFMNAFIKVGTEGKVAQAAQVMKTTWSSLAANIGNATKRMGEGVLKAFDDVFMTYNGRNLIQNLLGVDAEGIKVGKGIKGIIDDISSSIQKWIRANPQKITDFIEAIRAIDWKGFAKGMAQGFGEIFDFVQKLADSFGGKGFDWMGRAMVHLTWIGKAVSIAGGAIRGLRVPLGFITATLYKLIPKLGAGGLFGRLASLFGGLRGAEKARKIADLAPSIGSSFKLAFSKLAGAFTAFATVAAGFGTVAFSAWSVKKTIQNIHEIAKELNSFTTEEWRYAGDVAGAMVVFMGIFTHFANTLGNAATLAGVTSLSSFFSLPAIKGGLIIGGITTFITGLAALDTALIRLSFHNMKMVTQSILDSKKNLSELSKVKVNKTKVSEALEMLRDIGTMFEADYSDGFMQGGMSTTTQMHTKSYKTIIKNISETVESIKKTMRDLETLPELSKSQIDTAKKRAQNTIAAMKGIYKELMKEIDLDDTDMSNGSKNYQKQENVSVINQTAQIVKTIKDTLTDLKELEKAYPKLQKAKLNAIAIGKAMGEIFTEIQSGFSQWIMEYDSTSGFGGKQTQTKGINSNTERDAQLLKGIFESYSLAIGYIRDAYQTIIGESGEGFNRGDFDLAFNALGGKDGSRGIISKLIDLYDALTNTETGFGKFAETEIDLEGTAEAFANTMVSIKNMVATIQEIEGIEFTGKEGIGGVISSIGQMVLDLQAAFDPAIVQGVIEQISGFVTVVGVLLTKIKEMEGMNEGNPVELAITFTHTVNGKDEAIQAIKDANKAIADQVGKIKRVYNVPITVNLIPSVNKLPMPDASYPHTGGAISNRGVLYRAKGGSALFPGKPKGTDTVPIWATPGEYVQNKHAVDFFGIDFMRRVNHLDVAGALNTLMAKAGQIASVGTQTVVNNYYYNNQKVVQHVNTNSPDFAVKSASRFAGAF